jgi:CRP/FNR family transcriptional regulator, cyclic AMP receptor protein
MRTVAEIAAEAPIFAGMEDRHLELVGGCAELARFPAGTFLCREGRPADALYVLRSGRVTLEVAAPERGPIVIETLGEGDPLGWSWLFPPYRWHLDAVATEPVAALVFDAACLRAKSESDHELGYQLLRRFSHVMLTRLTATRQQLLDVYGDGGR